MKGRAPVLQDTPAAGSPSEAGDSADAVDPPSDGDGATDGAGDTKPKAKPKEAPAVPKEPKALREIREGEAGELKAYLESLGPQGSVRVRVVRTEPKFVQTSKGQAAIEGYLDTVNEFLDEDYIRQRWGGGTYDLTINTRNDKGSFTYKAHRIIKVSGEPKTDANHPQPTPPPVVQSGDSPVLVKEVFSILKNELDNARKPEGLPPAFQALMEQMRADADRRDRENEELRRELREIQRKDPPTDPLRDKLIDSLMGGESARIIALREQFASELRQTKEGHAAEVQRLEARHDRTVADMRQSHEREITALKHTYEIQIAALNNAHQSALSSAKAVAEVQKTSQDAVQKQLERELDAVRKDRDALRDKKDKSLPEQIKEISAIKELIGGDEDSSTTAGKFIEAIPAVAETIGGIVAQARGATAQPAQQATAQAQPQARRAPRVVAHPQTGQRFVQTQQGLVPVKKRPEVITNEAGTPVEAPTVDPGQLNMLINQMEQAFRRDEDPRIVAQTGRTVVPAEILTWIRDNDTEASSGLELFMQKVAKLPGTSPLATQGGRNWLRKVGKALIEGA